MSTLKEETLLVNINPSSNYYLQIGKIKQIHYNKINNEIIDDIVVEYPKSSCNKASYHGTDIPDYFIKLSTTKIK